MSPDINLDQVRQYNNSLKMYRDKAAKMQAAIEFNEKELNRLCAELSTALGVSVTPSNIEQIREEFIAKLNNTLSVGMDIIDHIKKSEEALASQAPTAQDTVAGVASAVDGLGSFTAPSIKSEGGQAITSPGNPPFAVDNIPPLFGHI